MNYLLVKINLNKFIFYMSHMFDFCLYLYIICRQKTIASVGDIFVISSRLPIFLVFFFIIIWFCYIVFLFVYLFNLFLNIFLYIVLLIFFIFSHTLLDSSKAKMRSLCILLPGELFVDF